MQLIRNILMDNKQHIQRTFTWRSIGKLYGWLHDICQDKEFEERTVQFLKVVEKHNLCFKQSKCDFNTEEILILEVVVGWGEVQMENDKVKVIKE